MLVRDLMRHEVVRARGDLSLAELCDLFQLHRVHGAPVVDADDGVVGFVSQEDILFGAMGSSRGKGRRSKVDLEPKVRDIMTSPAVSATEDTEVADLCEMMWRLRIHHVPVVREGKLAGIVSALDLCRAVCQGTIRA